MMKKMNWIYGCALCAAMSLTLAGCDDDNNDVPTPPAEEPFAAYYILSSGNMGNNNSSLTMYDPETGEATQDYFQAQNGRKLGDTAQDMIVYGDKMYIAVYGESRLEVTDLEAKSIQPVETEGQVRDLLAKDGKVYLAYYNGYVARLDTASLEVEAKVQVGRNPEQMAVSGDNLYVANSGGMDYNTPTGYDKTVSVVDLSSFSETKKIEVVINPTRIQADAAGNLYVISMGDYGDIPNTLQRIDGATGEVSALEACPNATDMVYANGKLYTYYSQWGVPEVTFTSYDPATGATDSWIKDGTTIASPYNLSAAGGYVFVAESDYKNNGDVYCFGEDGKLVAKVETGLNPMVVVLAQKDNQ